MRRANREKDRQRSELTVIILGFLLLLAVGSAGYMIIEGWEPLDALFMTVTTVATVGYGEVHPLSSAGRYFTMALIFSGVGFFGIVIARASQGLITKQLDWFFSEGRMNERIAKLSGHTIICGYGRLSRIAAAELRRAGQEVVIIDRDENRLALAENSGFYALMGDASLDETLVAAGVPRAARLLTLLPKASDNLYIILTAKELHPEIYIVSRAEEDIDDKRLRRAGANRVIAPYRIGGLKVAESLLRPYVSEFIDLTSSHTDLILEEIPVSERSPLNGTSLKQFGIREKTNIIIAAVVQADGQTIFNPSGETVIEKGSTLIGLGMREDMEQLEQLVDPRE
jgi:voltage-gated potassium channel